MKIKPIYIFFLILGLLSVSLVMAAEIDGDLQLHKGHKDPTYSEISNPNHHKISHNQSTDNNAPESNLTIDTVIESQLLINKN